MKLVRKILTFVVLPIVIILLVVIAGFYMYGEGIIKTAVEKAASSTLGVPVTIQGISLSLLQGKVGIRGLVVKNPPGYANENLLELGEGVVALDIGSLRSDPIKIQLIKLDGTKLTVEQKGLSNNLKDILDKLPKGEAKPATKEEGKGLNINRLEITGTTVKVKLLPIPGKADTVPLNLDPIVMENLGKDQKLSTGALVAKVLGALATGVAKQGAGVLPDNMVAGIGSSLGSVTQQGQKLLEETTGTGKGVVEGLSGILGGKKEEQK